MLALTDGTGDKYKFVFSEEMGHLVSLFVWAFDLYLMSFEGYVMDWAQLQAILEVCSVHACLEEFVPFWARLKGVFLDFYAFMFKDFRGFVGLGCVGRLRGDRSKHLMFVAGGPVPFFAAAKKNLVSWK
jgi:hypothetical protein